MDGLKAGRAGYWNAIDYAIGVPVQAVELAGVRDPQVGCGIAEGYTVDAAVEDCGRSGWGDGLPCSDYAGVGHGSCLGAGDSYCDEEVTQHRVALIQIRSVWAESPGDERRRTPP